MTLPRALALGLAALAIGPGTGCSSNLTGSDGGGGHGGNGTAGTGDGGRDGGGAGGQGGNPSIDAAPFACAMSVEQACAGWTPNACDLTWSAVQTDTSLCIPNTFLSRNFVHDCGGYHVLEMFAIDGGSEFYYDAASGALVAIVGVGISAGTPCIGGPTGGFTPPSSCNNNSPAPLPPPQCIGDAGNEGGTKG